MLFFTCSGSLSEALVALEFSSTALFPCIAKTTKDICVFFLCRGLVPFLLMQECNYTHLSFYECVIALASSSLSNGSVLELRIASPNYPYVKYFKCLITKFLSNVLILTLLRCTYVPLSIPQEVAIQRVCIIGITTISRHGALRNQDPRAPAISTKVNLIAGTIIWRFEASRPCYDNCRCEAVKEELGSNSVSDEDDLPLERYWGENQDSDDGSSCYGVSDSLTGKEDTTGLGYLSSPGQSHGQQPGAASLARMFL